MLLLSLLLMLLVLVVAVVAKMATAPHLFISNVPRNDPQFRAPSSTNYSPSMEQL